MSGIGGGLSRLNPVFIARQIDALGAVETIGEIGEENGEGEEPRGRT